MRKFQLKWSLYINSTGYSIAALSYIDAIQKADPDRSIKLIAINGPTKRKGISEKRFQWFSKLNQTPLQKDHISIQHCIPRLYISDDAKKRIGITVYETLDPPVNWIQKMNEKDHIITASQFNKGTFKAANLSAPVSVVPHCFDENIFHNDVGSNGRYRFFTFLYIATFKDRKNFPALIKAFYDAFEKKDNVCLLLKTDKPQQLKKMITSIKNNNGWKTKETAPIYIDEEIVDFEKMPQFMKKADVYVSPSLAEGFCLPALHAMALDIPVIITRYGGSLEYAKPDLCTYFNPHRYVKKLQMDGLPQFTKKIWPEIKISEIRDKLIFAYKSYPYIKELSKKAYDHVRQHFNQYIIGKRFLNVIQELENAV